MVSSGVRDTACVAAPTEGASTSHTPQQCHWQMGGHPNSLPLLTSPKHRCTCPGFTGPPRRTWHRGPTLEVKVTLTDLPWSPDPPVPHLRGVTDRISSASTSPRFLFLRPW